VQIVGYEAGVDDEAALSIATDGRIERESLAPGTTLAYTLDERHCAGAVDGDRHLACSAPEAPYCPRHTSRWPCARCRGDCSMPVEACQEEHAVYLAAFAPATCKVGVTRSWRLRTRLREQGADRAAHVRTVENGRIARRIEAALADRIGDRVRVPEKMAGLHRPVTEAAWRALLDEFDPIETYAFSYGLDLTDRPVAETMATGRIRGTQGRVLVLDRSGSTYAVDLRDLVGHEVTPEASSRERQASLDAFD